MVLPVPKSSDELQKEIETLRAQLAEAQEVIRAIQAGDVDAVVVSGPQGEQQIFTLRGAEYDYRALVEAMNEGAATLGGDGTVLYCNHRLADLIGIPLEQIIGSHVTKLISAEAMHDFEAMLARAWRGDSSTAELEFRAGHGKTIPVYLSLREMRSEDAALCMVVTDLTERKKVDELVTAGKLATSILDSAAEAIAVCDETGRIVRVNQALEVLCGTNLLFQRFEDALPLKFVDGSASSGTLFSIVLGGSTVRAREAVVRSHDQLIPVLLTVAPIKSPKGIFGCVVTMTDISARKRSEIQLQKLNRALKAQSNSIQALLHAVDESTYLKEVCRVVTEDCGHAMMWIGFAEDDKTVRPAAFSGFENGYLETLKLTWDDSEMGRGPTGSAIRTGQPTLCRNMLTDSDFLPWRAEAIKRGYASSLVVPLMEGNRAFGAFSIYSQEADAFSIAEIGLLTELAADLAFGIQTLRMRAAHARAEEILRESEARYRNLFNSMGEGFCIAEVLFDADGKPDDYRFLQVNPAFEQQTGLYQVVGKRIRELIPTIERHWFDIFGNVALSGEPVTFANEVRALGRWYDVHAYRVGAPELRQVAVVFNDISEHKRAEEILQRHAEMQRLSFDAIIVWRPEGGIESWNRGAEQLYGYTEKEALGQATHELLKTIRPLALPKVMERLHETRNWEGELRHTTKDGRDVFVTSRHQLVVGSDGVERILETNRDITDRKRAEEQLFAATQRMSALMRALPVGVTFSEDPTCRSITGNPAALAQFEVSAEDNLSASALNPSVAGRQLKFFQNGRQINDADLPLQRAVFENREIPPFEMEVLLPSGRSWIAECTGAPVRDADGNVVAGIAVTADITERKRAEMRLRRFFETDLFAILYWGIDGTVIDANDKYLEMTGYTRADLRAGLLNWAKMTPPEYQAMDDDARRQIKATGIHRPYEKEYIRRDGTRVWGLFSAAAWEDNRNEGVTFILDITDRKLAAQALLRSEKLASVGRMASTIAHEINNPLETIGNVVYLAMLDPGLSPEAKSYLEIAVQELERVTHITKQTLAFHRETSAPALIDLCQSIDSTVRLFAGRLESRGVTIKKRCPDVGRIKAFGGEIQQVIANLLSNSMDAVPDRGRIEFRLSRTPLNGRAKIRLTIADTGSGIAPERLQSVFEPFFTTKEMYGTGLGLWVTRQILEKHGAKIRVRSKVGKGTVFSIVFPVAEITVPQ